MEKFGYLSTVLKAGQDAGDNVTSVVFKNNANEAIELAKKKGIADAAELAKKKSIADAAELATEKNIADAGGAAVGAGANTVAKAGIKDAGETVAEKTVVKTGMDAADPSVVGKLTKAKVAVGAVAVVGGVAAVGAVGGTVSAAQSLADNADKSLTIIKMISGKNSGDVIITYSPEVTFVNNDSILIQQSNMLPQHLNDQFKILEIISTTQIRVNISDIMVFATSGTIILKTTLENRIAQTAENTTSTVNSIGTGVASVGTGVVSGVASSVVGQITSIVDPFMIYIKIFGGCICYLIILFIIWKIYSMFSKE